MKASGEINHNIQRVLFPIKKPELILYLYINIKMSISFSRYSLKMKVSSPIKTFKITGERERGRRDGVRENKERGEGMQGEAGVRGRETGIIQLKGVSRVWNTVNTIHRLLCICTTNPLSRQTQ